MNSPIALKLVDVSQDLSTYDDCCALAHRLSSFLCTIVLPHGWVVGVVLKAGIPYSDLFAGGAVFVRVGDPNGKCNVTGKPLPWWGRKFYISPHMTDGEIVQTVFLACKVAMEHELREQFLYKGQAIFDPHYDIEKLVELRSREDALGEREHGEVEA